MGNTLAIDIGGTKFTVALFADGVMRERVSSPTDRQGGRAWMLARIAEFVHAWKVPLDNAGIGFGGPVDFHQQRVYLSTHVGGWEDTDLIGWVRATFHIPAILDNDANAGALGEACYGAGQGHDPLFYMTLSTGIGGGIVTKGAFCGAPIPTPARSATLRFAPAASPACADPPVVSNATAAGCGWSAIMATPPELLADPAFVRTYVVDLALGLKASLMLLNPSRIVIGGGMAKAGDALFLPLREELARQMTAWSRARIDVVPAALEMIPFSGVR